MAVATCVQDMGPRQKTSWPTVTVGAKRQRQAEARQLTITSWCPSSTTTALHSFATPGRPSRDSRIRSAVSLLCSLSKRRLCLDTIGLWANAARSSSAISPPPLAFSRPAYPYSPESDPIRPLPTRSGGKSTGSRFITFKNARTNFFVTPPSIMSVTSQ